MSRILLSALLLFATAEAARAGSLPVRSPEDSPQTPGAMAHASAVNGLAFSPDGKTLYTAGDDGTVRTWDIATGRELRRIAASKGRIIAFALSGDGTRLATGGEGSMVRLWDATTGKLMRDLPLRAGEAEFISLSHDARWLAVSISGANRRFRASGDALPVFS